MLRSHVDEVGLHLQFSEQPCLNLTVISFWKPSGGTAFEPVMNCNSFDSDPSGLSTNWNQQFHY